MVTGLSLGLQVTCFSLLFIRMERATGMNDTERWAQSQLYDRRASSKNKILSLTAGGRNPAAAINPEEQDQALSYIFWFSHRMGASSLCRSRRPKDQSDGAFWFCLIQAQPLLLQISSCPGDSSSVLKDLWSLVCLQCMTWNRSSLACSNIVMICSSMDPAITADCPKFPQKSDVLCCCF